MNATRAEARKVTKHTIRKVCRGVAAAALGLLPILAACSSSGSSGRTTPIPQRTTLTVAGSEPTVIHTEAGVGERAFAVPAATVWRTMTDVYAQLEIPVEHMDPATMEIGNLRFQPRRIEGRRMSSYIDCGTNFNGALANLHEVTMSIMTRVEPISADSARVTTVMDAFAVPRSVSGNQVHCESLLTLEDRVSELATELLGGSF